MNRVERQIETLLREIVLLDGEQDDAPDLSDMARRAQHVLDSRKRRPRAVRAIAPGVSLETRRAERRDRMAKIRATVLARPTDA